MPKKDFLNLDEDVMLDKNDQGIIGDRSNYTNQERSLSISWKTWTTKEHARTRVGTKAWTTRTTWILINSRQNIKRTYNKNQGGGLD